MLYVSEGTLFAVPFDVDELAIAGGALPMVEGVRTEETGTRGWHFRDIV